MADLLPCPFCGGEARVEGGKWWPHVECDTCLAQSGDVRDHDAHPGVQSCDEAVAAWNRVLDSTERATVLTYMAAKQGRAL